MDETRLQRIAEQVSKRTGFALTAKADDVSITVEHKDKQYDSVTALKIPLESAGEAFDSFVVTYFVRLFDGFKESQREFRVRPFYQTRLGEIYKQLSREKNLGRWNVDALSIEEVIDLLKEQ